GRSHDPRPRRPTPTPRRAPRRSPPEPRAAAREAQARPAPRRPSGWPRSPGGPRCSTQASAVVPVDGGGERIGISRPRHLEGAERRGLAQFDESLLAQLEDGEEPDDDFEALADPLGQLTEARRPHGRQHADELVYRVAHTRS